MKCFKYRINKCKIKSNQVANDLNFGWSSVLGWKKTILGVILSNGVQRDSVFNLLENEKLGI